MSSTNVKESTHPNMSIFRDATIEVKIVLWERVYNEVMDHLLTVEGRSMRPDQLKASHWDFRPVFKAIGTGYDLKTSGGDVIYNEGGLRCYMLAIASGKRSLATDTYGNPCLQFKSHYR